MWIEQTEGSLFWLQILTELKNRGVNDILIACVDGLKGFPEAIESLNMTLRKVIKNRASFPNDDAVKKLLFLGLKNISKKWTMPIQTFYGNLISDVFSLKFHLGK